MTNRAFAITTNSFRPRFKPKTSSTHATSGYQRCVSSSCVWQCNGRILVNSNHSRKTSGPLVRSLLELLAHQAMIALHGFNTHILISSPSADEAVRCALTSRVAKCPHLPFKEASDTAASSLPNLHIILGVRAFQISNGSSSLIYYFAVGPLARLLRRSLSPVFSDVIVTRGTPVLCDPLKCFWSIAIYLAFALSLAFTEAQLLFFRRASHTDRKYSKA